MSDTPHAKVGVVIQAHMGSTRLPAKVMKLLSGRPLLWHVVDRSRRATKVDLVAVATSTESTDDEIEAFCKENNIACFRGSDADVTARYWGATEAFGLDTVVRVTSDCPLVDPAIIDRVIEAFQSGDYDYAANYLNYAFLDPVPPRVPSFPHGLEVEVYSSEALERSNRDAVEFFDREGVAWVWKNSNHSFRHAPVVAAPKEYQREYRLTVDYPEDFALIEKIYDAVYHEGECFDVLEAIHYLDQHQDIAALNANRVPKH